MCQYMATDGHVGPWHAAHLGALATGAPGMIMVEATGVTPQGRITIGCPSIEDDAHAMSYKPMIDFAHSMNVKGRENIKGILNNFKKFQAKENV